MAAVPGTMSYGGLRFSGGHRLVGVAVLVMPMCLFCIVDKKYVSFKSPRDLLDLWINFYTTTFNNHQTYQVSRISRETPAFWSHLPLTRRITKISRISMALNLVSWFLAKCLKLLPADIIFKAKMHQIRFRLELRPIRQTLSSCTAILRPSIWI